MVLTEERVNLASEKKVFSLALSEAVVTVEPLVYLWFSGGSPGIGWGTHMEVKAQSQTWVRFTPSKALVKEGVIPKKFKEHLQVLECTVSQLWQWLHDST